jgi:hypothetical protein
MHKNGRRSYLSTSESKESTIKVWGVFTVEHAHKIVTQKKDDALGKARKLVEHTDI